MPNGNQPQSINVISRGELSLGSVITAGWELFIKNIKVILIIVLIVYLPINIISGLLTANQAPLDWNAIINPSGYATVDMSSSQFTLVPLLEMLAQTLGTIAVAYVIFCAVKGQLMDYKGALKKALSRWLPAMGTGLLLAFFLVLLFLLLVVPGVIFGVFWAFALYSVILNDKIGLGALKYSKQVVTGRWFKVFGYLLVIGILTAIADLIVGSILPNNTVFNIIYATASDFIFCFLIAATTIFYLNLEANQWKKPEAASTTTSVK